MSQCYVLWLYFNLNTADQCIVHYVTTDKIDKHNIDCNSISVSNEYELNFALHTQDVQAARQRGSAWFSLLLQAYTNQSIKNGKPVSYAKMLHCVNIISGVTYLSVSFWSSKGKSECQISKNADTVWVFTISPGRCRIPCNSYEYTCFIIYKTPFAVVVVIHYNDADCMAKNRGSTRA